jgi:hypothetical protein
MTSDCKKLKKCSKYIKKWISAQPAVKEESLTDWLLYNLSQEIEKIKYKAFSRIEESITTGADWEWWLLFPSYNVRIRVQAKKVKPTKNNYPYLAYPNNTCSQIKNLLADANRTNSIPLYAFYTNLKGSLNYVNAKGSNEGVFLAGGMQIYSDFIGNGKSEVKPTSILKKCLPLSCLFCCPLTDDGERGLIKLLTKYYSLEVAKDDKFSNEIPGIYYKIPNYIETFIKYIKEGLPEWWEIEYNREIEGINALVVYDAREEKESQ